VTIHSPFLLRSIFTYPNTAHAKREQVSSGLKKIQQQNNNNNNNKPTAIRRNQRAREWRARRERLPFRTCQRERNRRTPEHSTPTSMRHIQIPTGEQWVRRVNEGRGGGGRATLHIVTDSLRDWRTHRNRYAVQRARTCPRKTDTSKSTAAMVDRKMCPLNLSMANAVTENFFRPGITALVRLAACT
jgi:hypothetical protein